MTPDRPLLGILLMLGFCALAPLGDALAKLLGETIPIFQLVLTRFAIQALILVPLALATGRSMSMSPRLFKLTILRTVLHIIGIAAMFTSLLFLPLAEAVAIAFVMPFIMLLLGHYVLNEEVGPRRMIACAVGFLGTMLVVQPSFAAVGLPALLPLLVAVVFALFMLVTRQTAKETDPIALQAVSGVIATVLLATAYLTASLLTGPLLTGPLLTAPVSTQLFDIIAPMGRETALLATIGVVGTLAHLLMVWSLRFAPSATVAPMQYLEIPIATGMGYLFFKDWPNGLAMLGICITIAAGLYVLYREHRTA